MKLQNYVLTTISGSSPRDNVGLLPDIQVGQSPAEPREIERSVSFPFLDYLRFAAAFGVFLSHSDPYGLLPGQFGGACVSIFFALSGFLIGGILVRSTPADLPRFYFNRTTRIWIPYFIAIALVLLATVSKQPLRDAKLWEFFFYDLTFVYNWWGPPQLLHFVSRMPLEGTSNHFWSICVEEQFYLAMPFVFMLPRRAVVGTLCAVIGIGLCTTNFFSAISLGVLLAIYWGVIGRWLSSTPAQIVVATFIASLLLVIRTYPQTYDGIFPFVAASTVALLAIRGDRSRTGKILGGLSFSFYLDAWVAAFAVNAIIKTMHVGWIGYPAHTAIILAVALLGSLGHYYFIDAVILRNRGLYYRRTVGKVCLWSGVFLVTTGTLVGAFLSVHPIN